MLVPSGNPSAYGAYFPAYLLKCLQDFFDRHGEDLYSELKHIRNALDQLLTSARFAQRVQRHASQLDVIVSTHCLLERRSAGTQDHPTDQPQRGDPPAQGAIQTRLHSHVGVLCRPSAIGLWMF